MIVCNHCGKTIPLPEHWEDEMIYLCAACAQDEEDKLFYDNEFTPTHTILYPENGPQGYVADYNPRTS